jgi:hypothetical protein
VEPIKTTAKESEPRYNSASARTVFKWGKYTGCPPTPLPLRVAKAGRTHLNEELTPLLPIGRGERYGQTISNLGHAALLCRCELAQ